VEVIKKCKRAKKCYRARKHFRHHVVSHKLRKIARICNRRRRASKKPKCPKGKVGFACRRIKRRLMKAKKMFKRR